MTNEANQIKARTMRMFDAAVYALSKEDYSEVLEEVIGDLEARLTCVKEEMEAEGITE